MPYLFIALFALDMLFAVLYIKEDITKKGFCYKMSASLIFTATGILAFTHSPQGKYAKMVLIGLILGMVGDFFLATSPFLKGENAKKMDFISSVIGGVFFLTGHYMYIIAFIDELKAQHIFKLPLFLAIWLGSVTVAFIVKTGLKVRLGKLAVPVLIYALTIAAMLSLGLNLSLFGFADKTLLKAFLFIAPVCFVISDCSLTCKLFDRERFNNLRTRAVLLSTYFCAQMLFAFSIYLNK